MPLSDEEKHDLQDQIDRCDKALADKPILASIFDTDWRENFRATVLGANRMEDIGCPTAYAASMFADFLPSDYQSRLEEGARVLLPKLLDVDKNGLISRLRGAGCVSAEEELLLARGFALEFGEDAVAGPMGNTSQTRPEFMVLVDGIMIAIEAKSLLDSEDVRLHWQAARFVGHNYWVSPCDTTHHDLKRVEKAIKKKIQQVAAVGPGIVVFTQYTAWPLPDQAANLIRQIAIEPGIYGIDDSRVPLAIEYVCHRFVLGLWFNFASTERGGVGLACREHLRNALRDSFYPRPDGVFFDDRMDDETHKSMLEKMRSHP